MRPRFGPLTIAACALLAVNALLFRFRVGAPARIALPLAALLLLVAALVVWRRS